MRFRPEISPVAASKFQRSIHLPARVRVEHGPPVRREGETVRDDDVLDLAFHLARGVDPIERAERLLPRHVAVVHRAHPEGPVGADLAVVQAGIGIVGLDLGDPLEDAALRIEQADLVPERDDETAGFGDAERAHFALEPVGLGAVLVQEEAVHRALGDVAPPQRIATVVEDRSLAEGATRVVQRFEFEGHRLVSHPGGRGCTGTAENSRRPRSFRYER